jgi:hypothetical protein
MKRKCGSKEQVPIRDRKNDQNSTIKHQPPIETRR